MSAKRFQNRVAESRMALPVTGLYAVVVCLCCGFWEQQMWIPMVLLALNSFLMLELNNSNALIRVYSRMVSCSYIVLAVMASFLLSSVRDGAFQMFFVTFFLLLFRAYQDKAAVGLVFYAFMMFGMASTLFAQLLYFLPVVWILLFTNIMAGSVRTFAASLLGLLMPYWCIGGYCLYTGDIDSLVARVSELWQFAPLFDFESLGLHRQLSFCIVTLIAIVGMVHFHRNSYKDKIRTRMLFEIFTTMYLCALVFIVLQPQHFDFLFGMMLICSSPLIGHFISLTSTRLTNIAFIVFLLAVVGVTVFNMLWMY